MIPQKCTLANLPIHVTLYFLSVHITGNYFAASVEVSGCVGPRFAMLWEEQLYVPAQCEDTKLLVIWKKKNAIALTTEVCYENLNSGFCSTPQFETSGSSNSNSLCLFFYMNETFPYSLSQ